jgi:hypothetical protein
MTTHINPLNRILFAALLALSLWMSAAQAVADTRPWGQPNLFDPGWVDRHDRGPRPIGHLGVTWE